MKREHLTLKVLRQPAPSALDSALSMFLLDAEARRLSPKTVAYYDQQLRPFVNWLQTEGVTSLSQLAPTFIRRYLIMLQQRELRPRSQHAAARAIRAWCNWLVVEGMLDGSPMRTVKMPKLDQDILPAFSPQDVKAILNACTNVRGTAVVLCLLDTGCRAAEFVVLKVGAVDMRTGVVEVRLGKGRKDRITILRTKARKALQKYLSVRPDAAPEEPLWISTSTGEGLTIHGLQQLLERLGKRANVPHCHPHTFRRTFALWSLRSGMNIFALQRLMGHSDLTVLRKYLALVEEDLQEAHRKHGAVDNML